MKNGPDIVVGTSEGREIKLSLDILMKTRLLVQANSGGGKSWLLRRLAEQLFGKVPVLIIDPEGEFSTLREKFGFVLVGKGGETPADARSAALVAHKLLELRASAVCDLYELKPHERHHWVKLFLEGLINAPKNLWRPTVIILDEAHVFCPEGKAGESEASGSVVDLATRGRKRRFCVVMATQRLGKLRKDATAELLNRLVGPTFEDVDLERAADLLSVAAADKRDFFTQMRMLPPGNFFALGRAICLYRTLLQVGPVTTSHEIEDARFGIDAPPAPEAVRALMPKLSDLPKQAEDKARTEAELRREISRLNNELKEARTEKAPEPSKEVIKEISLIKPADVARLEKVAARAHTFSELLATILLAVSKKNVSPEAPARAPPPRKVFMRAANSARRFLASPAQSVSVGNGFKVEHGAGEMFTGTLPIGERKILGACIQYPEGVARRALTVLTGYKRSSRDAYIARLKDKGFVVTEGDAVMATKEGGEAHPDAEPLPTGAALQAYWRERLPQGELAMFDLIVAAYPEPVDRERLTEATNYQRSSRDAYLARLRARELINEPGRGMVRANEELFE
jgi:uncharacterized protein DUF87